MGEVVFGCKTVLIYIFVSSGMINATLHKADETNLASPH